MTKFLNMVSAAAVCAVLTAASAGAADTWDMPTPYPDATFHTQNIIQFAQDVDAATNGEMKLTVHSAGSLFPHPEIKNAVRSGQVNIGEFFLSRLSNENEAYGVDSLPFLATSYTEAEDLWAEQKPVITKLLAEEGLMPLFAVAWPPQGLYSSKPVEKIEDMQGLKFRAYNASLEKFAKLAGAAPVQVEVPDIPQAFATGRVESMITSPSTGVNSKAWDFVKNYYDIQAWLPKNIVVVNKAAFDALPEATQAAILEAAATAEARGWQMSREETATKTDELGAAGMNVSEPSDDLLSSLKQLGSQLLIDWQETAGDDALGIINAFKG